jgi:hypothetical protein
MANTRYAVLIADVIGSSGRRNLRTLLARTLDDARRAHLKSKSIRLPYAVTAGDEFQTILSPNINIPELIFDLRMKARPLRLRIGIGFGALAGRIQPPVNLMGGEAFQRARQALESIKAGNSKYDVLTAFRSGREVFDSTANLIYALHDTLLLTITNKQWDTIQVFRQKRSLASTARVLRLDGSTVSRNLKRSYFWQIEQTISAMDRLIRASKL